MKITVRRAKWIMVMACLVMAFCLAQRSFNLPGFSANAAVTTAFPSQSVENQGDDVTHAAKPCELSAKSLHGSEPALDLLHPFLILLLTLVASVCYQASAQPLQAHTFPPPRRRHLTFCVFRE